jgi:hypothetical protein
MPLQYLLTVRINFAMEYGSHAGSLEAEVEAPNASKKRREPNGIGACGEAGLVR